MDFIQAKDSYRFSSDALLLADFANVHLSKNLFDKKRGVKPPFLFLDLGCACGVIGIQILKYVQKHYPDYIEDTYVLGIDKELVLVESAHANAEAFGFQENYHAICADIKVDTTSEIAANSALCDEIVQNWAFEKIEKRRGKMVDAQHGVCKNPRVFDAVITNPPWYNENNGKVSQGTLRRDALFGDKSTMRAFLEFAEKKLKKNASLYMVGKSSNFADCVRGIPASLNCTTMQNVHARQDAAAIFFLLEARFQSKSDMVFPAPLFLNPKDL